MVSPVNVNVGSTPRGGTQGQKTNLAELVIRKGNGSDNSNSSGGGILSSVMGGIMTGQIRDAEGALEKIMGTQRST